MDQKILELISGVLNPNTGKSLQFENRYVTASLEDDRVYIKYRRDGITPEQKRVVEEQILAKLSKYYDTAKVTIATISDQKPAAQTASQGQAELKVGHGTVGNKKRINGVKSLIAVASGKGGVGKSTFSVNLACSLVNEGKKVGLIDADIYGPSIPMLLNKRNEKPMANDNKKIIPVESYGIHFMSFGLFINENEPVIWRGPMLGGVLNQFLFDVDWGDLDVLIIDLPPGTGDMQLSMIQNVVVDGAIIISTPQDVALLDAVKGLEMFRKLAIPVVGVVENMSYFICDGCDKKTLYFW